MKITFSVQQTLVALWCVPSLVIAATPAITSVSGAVQTGQTLTITGTNMVNENRTNWDPFFINNANASSFEGANPTADGYNDGGPFGGTYDGSVKVLGNKSMRFHTQGASGNCPSGNLDDANSMDPAGGDSNDLWIRFYARWSLNGGGWPTSHIKMIDSQGGGLQYYFQPDANSGGNRPSTFNAIYDGASHSVSIPGGQLQNNRWYAIEIHWKSAGANVFDAWIDNTQVLNASPTTEGSLDYIIFGLINLCGTNSSFNLDHWIDGLAVGTSRVNLASLIEIGNSPDYATATKVYQVPEYLSETSSQIKVNLSGLGAGPHYLWVTNNRGERSNPFDLTSFTFPTPQNLRLQ